MKHRYEGLLILNVKGSDEGVKEIIEHLETDFKNEGAIVEQVQKMDRRQFTYVAGPLDSGYYVNFIFNAEPQALTKLRGKLTLNEDVYRQHFQRLPAKKEASRRQKAAAAATAAA